MGVYDLAKQITFEEARLKARDRKAEAETNAEKMARLKAEAPDLADLSGMSLDEAMAKLNQRKADEAKLNLIAGQRRRRSFAGERRRACPDATLDAETLYCSTWQGVRTCSSPEP